MAEQAKNEQPIPTVKADEKVAKLSRRDLTTPIQIENKKLKLTAECLPQALPEWEKSGWTRVENKK